MLIIFTSCGSYQKLLKSDNSQKKYEEAVKYFYNKEYTRAVTLFGSVAGEYMGSMREDTITFYTSKALYNMRDFEQASEMMNSFRYKFSRSPFTEEAEYIYAMCFYNESGTYERDQSASHRAIQAFTEYLNRYPESIKKDDIYAIIDELQERIYLKHFNNAALYYKLGKYNSAITAMKSVMKNYPEIPQREEIMFLICKSWFEYAEKSIESRQLDRYLKMMDAYYSYKSDYPNNVKRLKDLDDMFEKAKSFTDENGFASRTIEKTKINIQERYNRIAELKDKRFYAATKEERKKITEEIKFEQESIKKDRAAIRENKREIKLQTKQKSNLEKIGEVSGGE